METWEQFVRRIEDPPLEPDPRTIHEVLVDALPCFICQGSKIWEGETCRNCGGSGIEHDRIQAAKTSWRCPRCGKRGSDMLGGQCCNPRCKGMWGTGCYCCHHPKYLLDWFDPEYE